MAKTPSMPLAVWMYGSHVATLSEAKGKLSLRYTEEAVDTYTLNTPLLSLSLPVLETTFKHDAVHPFFDGLLPEGRARQALAYDMRVPDDDTFALLGILGRDCAGALVLIPEGEPEPQATSTPPPALTIAEVATRLLELSHMPLGVDGQVRISLAGVQTKTVLTQLASGRWALPIDGWPSTHILKRTNDRFPDMIVNEAFCMALGRHLGLQVADTTLMPFPHPSEPGKVISTLVSKRYDRVRHADGRIERLHQEDFTQALKVPVGRKYQDAGGPDLESLARLVRTRAGRSSLGHLVEVTFLNMLVGNADAHAKNLSLLYPMPGAPQLAPAYDVLSTAFYPGVQTKLAMMVNAKTDVNDIHASDVIEEVVSWGYHRQPVVVAWVADLLQRVDDALNLAAVEVPQVSADLVTLIRQRAAAFKASLPA